MELQQILTDINPKNIPFNPIFFKLTNSVNSAILLQAMLNLWFENDRKPFMIFRAPCKHPLYKEGNSWTEKTGMKHYHYDAAIRKVGVKTTKDEYKPTECFACFWAEWPTGIKANGRVTYFQINEEYLTRRLTDVLELSEV